MRGAMVGGLECESMAWWSFHRATGIGHTPSRAGRQRVGLSGPDADDNGDHLARRGLAVSG